MSEPIQPTPPVPASPPAPPVPRYGEYAPAGYVPPQPAPGYEAAAGLPAYGSAPAAGGRKRRTWDLVLTIVLLVMGLFGAFFGVIYGIVFTNPDVLSQALAQQGYPDFHGDPGAAPAILIVSHVLLYLIAAGGSIPLLVAKRIAFWLPLAAGVIAAIIFWGTLTAVVLSDPAFVSTYS